MSTNNDNQGIQFYQTVMMEKEKMEDNIKLWEAVRRPPKEALKTIKAGRLAGMSDINPQWRLQKMTEQFGVCGIGWYYEIKDRWVESGANGEVMAFIKIDLFINNNGGWSAPIVGIGGAALVAKESSGLRANDEAYKMATTDALSVAMKQLGVAADIYMGLWDGTKYRDEKKPESSKPVGQVDYESLNEGRKRFVDDIAEAVKTAFSFDVESAYQEWVKNKPEDGTEQSACWWKIDSNIRSSIKKHGLMQSKTKDEELLDA